MLPRDVLRAVPVQRGDLDPDALLDAAFPDSPPILLAWTDLLGFHRGSLALLLGHSG